MTHRSPYRPVSQDRPHIPACWQLPRHGRTLPSPLAGAALTLAAPDTAAVTVRARAAVLALLAVAFERSAVEYTVRRCVARDAVTIGDLRTAAKGLI
ncbi:hypothetical protein ACFVH6_21640 [Spirillospora sp. NPDC127200]